jgi:acyl-[acyl-carrier-protein] desaturase
VKASKRQVFAFAMPGIDFPEFRSKALEMSKAGIYDLRIHRDQVVIPVVFTHWKIDQLTVLTEDAEEARNEISQYLELLDAMARKYEDKRAQAQT